MSLCARADPLLGFSPLDSLFARVAGYGFITLGFGIRMWAAYYFYLHRMGVIRFEPQKHLLTTGPYRFSRNPLYVGGNVFIFLGAALVLGSPSALIATALHLPLVDSFIRREERQLERDFGDEFREYKSRVRRWV